MPSLSLKSAPINMLATARQQLTVPNPAKSRLRMRKDPQLLRSRSPGLSGRLAMTDEDGHRNTPQKLVQKLLNRRWMRVALQQGGSTALFTS